MNLAKMITLPLEAVARLRENRVFHPQGLGYVGTLRLHSPGALDGPGEQQVVVRISKAVSTPGGLPDILGVALHLDLPEGPLDLLFATTGRPPLLRHALLPRASFTSGTFTTLLPYRVGGRVRVLGLLPASARPVPARLADLDAAVRREPLAFDLATAPLLGDWTSYGTLEVHTPLREPLEAFDPQLRNLPGLHPTGPFQTLRRYAYAASRRGRRAVAAPSPAAVTGPHTGERGRDEDRKHAN